MPVLVDQFGQAVGGTVPAVSAAAPAAALKAADDLPVREDDLLRGRVSCASRPTVTRGLVDVPAGQPARLARGTRVSALPLGKFPLAVNDVSVRLFALQVFVLTALGIALRNERWMHYVIGGVFADFCLFAYGGTTLALMGNVAELGALLVKPRLVPGPSRQVPAFMGTLMTGIATILFFSEKDTAGAVVLGLVMGLSFVEAVMGISIGAYIIDALISAGLVDRTATLKCHAAYPDMAAYATGLAMRLNEPLPPEVAVHRFEANSPSAADLGYKKKTPSMSREHQHPVKYVQASYFGMSLAFSGLALSWRSANPKAAFNVADGIYETLAVIGGVLFSIFALLYLSKCVLYPQKVHKEWRSMIAHSAFSIIPTNMVVFSTLAMTDEPDFGAVLFWIAAPLQGAASLYAITNWLVHTHDAGFVNPAYMVPVLGNFVVAIVAPTVRSPEFNWEPGRFVDVGWLFFAVALSMWLVLLVITFQRQMHFEGVDPRLRPMFANYVGAPSVAGIAWLSLNQGQWDNTLRVLYWTSWGFVLVLVVLALRKFFGKPQFHMGDWAFVFTLSAQASLSIEHYVAFPTRDNFRVSLISMAIANGVGAIVFVRFLGALFTRKVFVAEERAGPIGYVPLTQAAMMNAANELKKYALRLDGSAERLQDLLAVFEPFSVLVNAHLRYEDAVVFGEYDGMAPLNPISAATGTGTAATQYIGEAQAAVARQLARLGSKAASWGAAEEKATHSLMADFLSRLEDHVGAENAKGHFMARKNIPIAMQVGILRAIWSTIPPRDWAAIFPFVLEHMPTHPQRVAYLVCFRWVMPDRMHQIGRFIYHRTDAYLWDRLARDVPEIVPRGVPGYLPANW